MFTIYFIFIVQLFIQKVMKKSSSINRNPKKMNTLIFLITCSFFKDFKKSRITYLLSNCFF